MKWKSLYKFLDNIRKDRGMSWRQLGRECDLHSSTFTRLKHGRGLSATNLWVLEKSFEGTLNAARSAR